MSSLRNAVSRRAHKERAQPESRKKFGLLEKHKDYVERAKAYHKKEETLRILKQKAFYRNPDEFNFKMIRTRTVNGVHKLESQANKYTPEELMLMKTQDIGYIFQKVQSEKKKIEKLTATLHSLDNRPSSRHVYFAEDREEAREIQSRSRSGKMPVSEDIPDHIKSMSSLRNAVSRRAHKERAQPESRKKFGLLEKHKDYVECAKAYHKKEETLRILKQKAFYRNPDEFNFKMIKTRTVNGVHKLESQANKYTPEELMLMKTQDIGYIFQKVQSEKKKIEMLTATLHSLDNRPLSRHVYFAEDTFTLPKTDWIW